MLKLIVAEIQEDHDFFYWKIIWSNKDLKENYSYLLKQRAY